MPARARLRFSGRIGEEMASEIFKFLEEDEVQLISKEIASLQRVSSDAKPMTSSKSSSARARAVLRLIGRRRIRPKRLLVKAYGPEIAKRLLDKITRSLETTADSTLCKSRSAAAFPSCFRTSTADHRARARAHGCIDCARRFAERRIRRWFQRARDLVEQAFGDLGP